MSKKVEDYYVEPYEPSYTAMQPEARENELINAAYDLAEKRIREGTASDTMITHFLKMGSQKERLERMMLAKDVELKAAKTEALQSAKRIEELYAAAIGAAQSYRIDDDEDGEIIQ